MTRLIPGILFFLLTAAHGPAMAFAEDASVEVMVSGRKFCSFEAYARSRGTAAAEPMKAAPEELTPAPPEVAGISPSLAEIVREFKSISLDGKPLCAADGLAEALARAAQGKEGPLLVVADASKLRILELE